MICATGQIEYCKIQPILIEKLVRPPGAIACAARAILQIFNLQFGSGFAGLGYTGFIRGPLMDFLFFNGNGKYYQLFVFA